MKFGVSIANFGVSSNPQDYVNLAQGVEAAGWDGFFLWDHINWREGIVNLDPWILLSAIATETEKVLIGPLVTPLPRRRPQKVARESLTLDHLSKGRFVFGVGLGWPPKKEYGDFGEPVGINIRAKMLDEGLKVITGLWSGTPLDFQGEHYTVTCAQFKPKPYRKEGIPIWVAGTWPKKGPFQRAAKYNGIVPMGIQTGKKFSDMMEYVNKYRKPSKTFDWVSSTSYISGPKRDRIAKEFRDAGATWYIESWGTQSMEKQLPRIKRGPPAL